MQEARCRRSTRHRTDRASAVGERFAWSPRDAIHPTEENDEDRLFNRSATFHSVMLSARGMFGSPETWHMYGRQLTELTNLLEAGDIDPPAITEVGGLSVEGLRRAHAMLESGHVQGKLVMLVG